MDISNLTVIIPTRNEIHNITAALNSIPPIVPVILIDASSDNTAVIAQTVRPSTKIIFNSARIAQARQIGAVAAKTNWLLFSDADIVFTPDYFSRLGSLGPVEAVYGPKLSQGLFKTYCQMFAWDQQVSHWLGVPAVSGSNFLIKKETLEMTGGFDLNLICNENSELGWRIKRSGSRIKFDPHLIVYARDHRRLLRGLTRTTLHLVVRCLLLYFNLVPQKWLSCDWGYWSASPTCYRSADTPSEVS